MLTFPKRSTPATCSEGTNVGSDLLLLARRFPFNHGEVAAESYLETEIGLLAPHFDKILAVGTEAPAGDKPTCALPGNVEAVALGCVPTKAHKAALTARGMMYSVAAPEKIREAMATDPVDAVKKRAFRGYFTARAYEKYSRLVPELRKRSFGPTSIYSFWLYDAALAALWARGAYPCARAVARAHRYDLYRDRTGVGYLPFRELLLSGLDAVLPCSEDGRAYIDANWPGHSEKLYTSYLGTADLPDLSGAPREGLFHIVSCSRAVPVKRIGLIADALAILDAEGRRVRWTHYGDGSELPATRERCAGFSSVVAEFPGSVQNADLLQSYGEERIDLFINASESEGLPISIMEACGVGAPVLATDVGGTREVVEDGANGVLLPADPDTEEIACAIVAFVEMDDEETLRMRQASRRVWESRFRAAKNVGRLVDLLEGGGVA